MRRLPALLSTAALVTVLASSLTACSGIPGFGGCERPIASGDASELVEATGSFGSKPTVDFPTPLIATAPQQSVIIAGEGDPIPNRGTVDFEVTLLLGETGEQVTASAYDGTSLLRVAGLPDALSQSMECAQVGERYALTTTTADAFGVGALADAGISDDATLVLVVDVIEDFLGKADGINQLPQDGMPAVVTAPNGTPGITVPVADAPTEERVSLIKAGGGAKVAEDDQVVLHFSAWTWPAPGEDPAAVDSTWKGAPIIEDAAGRLAPGVLEKVVGTQVGSQLLVVIPASTAYPGAVPSNVDSSSTLIFVVDVLGIFED